MYICNKRNTKWCQHGKDGFFCESAMLHEDNAYDYLCIGNDDCEHRAKDIKFNGNIETQLEKDKQERQKLIDDNVNKILEITNKLSMYKENIDNIKKFK